LLSKSQKHFFKKKVNLSLLLGLKTLAAAIAYSLWMQPTSDKINFFNREQSTVGVLGFL
jgi:hypothetical protein